MVLGLRYGVSLVEPQHPILAHAPNLSFHSCLYFSHHSSSQVWRVSPHTMILNRACSSAVQATPSNSPLVTGAWLRRRPAEASRGNKNKVTTADVRMIWKSLGNFVLVRQLCSDWVT